jgi:hypothetical protein
MKKNALTLAIITTFIAAPAISGTLSDAAIEQDIIIEETKSSSDGVALVALLAILVALPALTD